MKTGGGVVENGTGVDGGGGAGGGYDRLACFFNIHILSSLAVGNAHQLHGDWYLVIVLTR